MVSRDLITNAMQADLDIEMSDFFTRLMLGIKNFDETFFDFF
jgi:hypothetical protein